MPNPLDSLPSLKLTVDVYDLMAKKSLGQNFLLDKNITDKIIRLSLSAQGLKNFEGQNVFEIGPGPGGLTRSILYQSPQKLTVIEMDDRCIKIMNDIKEKVGTQLEIINGDALKTDISKLESHPRHVISNLPYNISVPLLISWLKSINSFESLTLMFQKEVAERIMANINSKDYGRISILSQLLCKVEKLMDVSPESFTPAPKIWSSVLLFKPTQIKITEKEIEKIEKITSLAFGQRRKMIRQSLKSIPELESLCEKLSIKPTDRAENIPPEKYLELSRLV